MNLHILATPVRQRHFPAEHLEIKPRSESEGPTATRSLAYASGFHSRRGGVVSLTLALIAVVLAGQLRGDDESTNAPQKKVVIPFDFESKFDEGRYGRIVGDMLWKKLDRDGGYILPESMLDVRDWSERTKSVSNHETSLDKMKKIIVDDFGADIGIWGKVERVKGFELDVYDLWIKVADFSGDAPRMIHESHGRTKTVSEIPHVYVMTALEKLTGRGPEQFAGPDPEAEQRWKTGHNLVQGDFDKGRDNPTGWDPIPRYASRVVVPKENNPKNQVMRFQFPKDVAASTGVLFYSDYFPVEESATYRFQCKWRTTGSAVKVFIKCYDELPTRFEKGQPEGQGTQRREVYRSQQNLKGGKNDWHVHTEDFTPKHTQFKPRYGRVMLYANWPAGAVDWDDVVVKQIKSPTDDSNQKVKRPSLETRVLSEEIEQRNKQAKQD
jgi:hypothetical protein